MLGEATYAHHPRVRHSYNVIAPWRTDGEITGILGLNLDMTERIGAEEGLRESERRIALHVCPTQKIESRGQLAAVMAHEFNHFLTPMLLRLEMLRIDRADDSSLFASLRSIKDAINQAARLNQRILSVPAVRWET